jgi:membrane fusion protein, heavy metal efflux system
VGEQTLADIREGRPVAQKTSVIRSPIDGTVVEKLITPGQLLEAGATPCFTVADLSTVWVMAHVFDTDLPSVSVGDPAEVATGVTEERFPGKVDYVAAMVDPATRATAVRIVARNHRDILKKDLYVRVSIQSRQDSTGLLAPVSAILRDDQNLPFVFVDDGNGGFGRRPVELGARVGDRQEILSGLEAGDRVVVEGGLFMQFAESQ